MAAKKPWLAKQHPAKRLARLLGTWSVEAVIPGLEKPFRGTATFRWLEKDKLMVMKTAGPKGGMPASTSVLGADDVNDELMMLYADERGVTRIYEIEMTKTQWRWKRSAPRFSQRFVGTFSKDGKTIHAVLKKAVNGGRMSHDFDVTYTRRSK